MDTVGLRKLRRNASEFVRRVEAGEELTITVGGRPSARLVPIAPTAELPKTWRTYEEIADLWSGSADDGWEADRDLIDQRPPELRVKGVSGGGSKPPSDP
ncbi:type II toxin-antitoxin system Phd/YefM family antitoxin [Nocardia alni]|uniref:type II toxin-antitoxin system Phd/YefM family antitoxin n=1 Tax=Nocardia alni TaxID=2815723 RepID=UPI001C23E121|nr:type II toxin-antitoxin system prevent-host-death family antitoxin [Nocardia alni]